MDKKDLELLIACENRNIDNVKKALKKSLFGGSAYVNARGDDWRTPLIIAAENGDLEIVQYLINEGANVNYFDKKHYSPLYYAADKSHIEIVKILLENGASTAIEEEACSIPIETSAENGCVEIIDLLISYGVDINSKNKVYMRTPLILAAIKGDTETVKYLTGKGADLDLKGYDERTALMWAVDAEFIDIVKHLLENGACTDLRDDEGKSAFDIAYENENYELEKLLKEYDASGSDIDFSGHKKQKKEKMALSVSEILQGAVLLCPKCKRKFNLGPNSLFMAFEALDNNSSVSGAGYTCQICSKESSIEEWYQSTLETR